MLQQTQVATVIPYYHRFLERFPTVADLADAPLDDVLQLWAGLGYYARARHLHAAARCVVEQHGGRFPDTVEALQRLPGVGRYTAGAIASIAFGRRAPILDGNVKRVLARLFAISADPAAAQTIADLWDLAEHLLPRKRCGDFNQALMELGAMVCVPKAPRCGECPVQQHCAARATGQPTAYPSPKATRPVRRSRVVVAALVHDAYVLLRQRPLDGLWAGLWEVPSQEVPPRTAMYNAVCALTHSLVQPDAVTISARPTGRVKHQLTHRNVEFVVYGVRSLTGHRPIRASARRRWVKWSDVSNLALGTAQRKVIRALRADVDA